MLSATQAMMKLATSEINVAAAAPCHEYLGMSARYSDTLKNALNSSTLVRSELRPNPSRPFMGKTLRPRSTTTGASNRITFVVPSNS